MARHLSGLHGETGIFSGGRGSGGAPSPKVGATRAGEVGSGIVLIFQVRKLRLQGGDLSQGSSQSCSQPREVLSAGPLMTRPHYLPSIPPQKALSGGLRTLPLLLGWR